MATKKAEAAVEEVVAETTSPEPVDPEKAAKKEAQRTSNRLYTEATAELREAHKDEFQAILERKYAAAGLAYVRRLTKEEREAVVAEEKREKARQKLEELYAKFPELRP